MAMRLSKVIKIFCFFCMFLSCKNDAQEKDILIQKNIENISIDFFQKADKELYTIIVDESNISDHPILSYLDCKNEGYFSIHFIPKSYYLKLFWQNQFLKNYDHNDINLEKVDKDIRTKLENKHNEYNIFSFQITKEYLDSNNGCTIESIYPKKGSKANVYWYNQKNEVWELLKRIDVDFLPPYADDNFFIANFPRFFSNQSKKSNEDKNISEIIAEKEIVFQITTDFDKDNISEKIELLKNTKTKDPFDQQHFYLPVEIYKGSVLWKSNNNLIADQQNNCVSEGFQNIVIKNNYFTIEAQSCYDYNILVNTFTTFKVIGNEIYLFKYGENYFDKSNHNNEIASKVWTSKDFGEKSFESVTSSFLFNLRKMTPK